MNPRMFMWAVAFVGVTLLVSVAGIILLSVQSLNIPDILQNVAVGSLTALVSLIVNPAGKQ